MRVLLPLSAILFLQLFCMGITFTALPALNEQLGGGSSDLGWLFFAFSAPRAITSPFWGFVSDRYGRKPVLVLGTVGMMLGSLVWSFSTTIPILLASRLVDSLLSAQGGITKAVVADATTREQRSVGMGLIGAAISLALTAGPLTGAIVGGHWAEQGISLARFGWIMLVAQGLALLLILFWLPETLRVREASTPPSRSRRFLHIAGLSSVSTPALWILALTLVVTVAYTQFTNAYPTALKILFDLDEEGLVRVQGHAFALIGLIGALVQGALLRPLVPRWGEKRLILAGIALMAVSFILFSQEGVLRSVPWRMAAVAVLAVGSGLALPVMTGFLSCVVPESDQGRLLGLAQSSETLGRGLGPLLAGWFITGGPELPFLLSTVILAVCAVLMVPLLAVPDHRTLPREEVPNDPGRSAPEPVPPVQAGDGRSGS